MKNKISSAVNSVYWNIDKLLFENNLEGGFGCGVVKRLSVNLKEWFPDMHTLWDMKRFYDPYNQIDIKVQQRLALLPSGNIIYCYRNRIDSNTK